MPSDENLDRATKVGLFIEDTAARAEKFRNAKENILRTHDNKLVANEETSRNLARRGLKGLSFVGSKLPFGLDTGTFNNIITQNKQIVIDSRENATNVVGDVTTGLLTPQEGLAKINRINDTINQAEYAIHITSRYSLKAYLEGLGTEEAKLIKARDSLEGDRNQILLVAAQQAAGKVSTSDQILESLT